MSTGKFKAFLKTTPGKLLLLCSVILVGCWSFMLIQFAGGFSSLFPSEEKIKNLKQDVRKLRSQVEENRKKAAKYDRQRKEYRENLVAYWNEERDGLVDTVLRNTIQNAAKELELTLTALGSVRITRINQELFFAEVDNLSATAPYDVLIKFFAKLEESKPSLHWKRLDLRPDHRRINQNRNRNSSLLQLTPATMPIRFYGALRVIGYDGKLPVKGMKEKQKMMLKKPVLPQNPSLTEKKNVPEKNIIEKKTLTKEQGGMK